MKTYILKVSTGKLVALSNNIIAVNGGSTPHPSTGKILKTLSNNKSLLGKSEIKEVIFGNLVILN